MKEGIVMTKEKALQATKLLEEIETIDMLNEELANFWPLNNLMHYLKDYIPNYFKLLSVIIMIKKMNWMNYRKGNL